MVRPNPFQNDRLLRAMEAYDRNIFIDMSDGDTAAVSYEQFERLGLALANHTTIYFLSLRVPKPEDNVDLAGWLRFLELTSRNRSVKHFHYVSNHTAERPLRVISALIFRQFFEGNDALEFVRFRNLGGPDEAEEFASALASRMTTLNRIVIDGVTSLQILRLIFEIKPSAIPKVISIENFGNEGADALAQFLESANDVDIRELDLSTDFGPRGLQSIARALAGRDSTLDSLEISSDSDFELVDFALGFWENPDSLPNRLDLWIDPICFVGCVVFGTVLVRRRLPLDKLSLGVDLDDHVAVAGVTALLKLLRDNPSKTPKHLHFCVFHDQFMEQIEELLRNRVCPMEMITFDDGDSDDLFDFFLRFTSICCNETSFNTTYDSNHTFMELHWDLFREPCPQLEHYLAINRNPDKKKVARIKIYDAHFARNFQPGFFADMQPSLLSEVLPFVNQAFADYDVFTSEATPNGNEAAEQVTNNSLSIHFMMLKEHPSLLSNRLINRH